MLQRLRWIYVCNEVGAGNVRIHPHIQLPFIFSPFFSLIPFRFDLSGFLSSNADRLTANSTSQLEILSKSNLCPISKLAYQTPHIKFLAPSSSNFSYIDLCSVSPFSCFSENLPSDLSPGQCPGKNKLTKETHHRLWLQAICKSGQCLSERLPLPTSSWIIRHPSRTSRPTPSGQVWRIWQNEQSHFFSS